MDVDAGCESTNSVTNLIITREVGVCEPTDYLKLNLKRFWETESIGIYEEAEEKRSQTATERFNINIEREDERYSVNLPWKSDSQPVSTHYELSKTRLNYLKQKLERNRELMKKYDDIIKEQLQTGIIEPVSLRTKKAIRISIT